MPETKTAAAPDKQPGPTADRWIKAKPSSRATRPGARSLAAMSPLPLDPAHVDAVGIVRAAVDAVHALPEYLASREAARATHDEASRAAHVRVASALIRRTAEAHAKRGASFRRPEAAPPF